MTKMLIGRGISQGIIQSADFCLRQGEVIALMGPNGAGKSTLARIMAGLLEPVSGEVSLVKDGQIIPWSKVRRWQEVGIIGQAPRRQTIGATVGEELGVGFLNLGYEVKKVQELVRKLADELGLGDKLNQSPATLSGGERQRLVLGAVLALNPAFILLDEALSMLDTRAQKACLKLLKEKGKSMGQLWITHDPKLAEKADRLWVMKDGKALDMGNPIIALNDSDLIQELTKGYKTQEEIGDRYFKVQSLRCAERLSEGSESPILEWQEAEYGSRLQLTESIKEKSFLAILGPSGAGKSTLLESALALIHPSQGRFLAFGQEVTRKTTGLGRRACLLLQEPGEYIIGSTVYDEVFYLLKKSERKVRHELNLDYLQVFGVPADKTYAFPEALSGGERQRVALAAVLESLPDILLLDEPLLGIDASGKRMFQDLLQGLKGKMTILYVTHDWWEVRDLADEVWLVEEGRITLKGLRKDHHMVIDMERLKEAGVRC